MFCGPETIDVSRGEAEGNIDGRGSTKHTAFPRSQSISVLLYINSQRNNKLKKNERKYMKYFIVKTLNLINTVA